MTPGDVGMAIKLARALALVSCVVLVGCGHTRSTSPLSRIPNTGPCPASVALSGAERLIEIRGNREIYSNVGFTGEITQVNGYCRYASTEPIVMQMEIDFSLGRGPAAADDDSHRFVYFVSVTRSDRAVIATERFAFDAVFAPGQERLDLVETLEGIVIPRLDESISGANFEIIVGFELTEQQLAFNRQGKRFRLDADSR